MPEDCSPGRWLGHRAGYCGIEVGWLIVGEVMKSQCRHRAWIMVRLSRPSFRKAMDSEEGSWLRMSSCSALKDAGIPWDLVCRQVVITSWIRIRVVSMMKLQKLVGSLKTELQMTLRTIITCATVSSLTVGSTKRYSMNMCESNVLQRKEVNQTCIIRHCLLARGKHRIQHKDMTPYLLEQTLNVGSAILDLSQSILHLR